MARKTNDDSSLSHTKWNLKYHIVFIPKYRRKEIYGKIRSDIGRIIRQLCEYKGVEIIEVHAMSDHIHMLVRIPPKIAISNFMGYLKGKSSLMIFERHANLKYKYGNRSFWAKGYFVSTVVMNAEVVKEYIRNQEKEDMMEDNLSTKEYKDPFKR
ncbi:MAG: IS200/IS605 family transposase [Acholeplasmatales bacterium]|jgi:putative transposase|nr:IS200/IS605 family transposase [Acholeplasmatales bacterium]